MRTAAAGFAYFVPVFTAGVILGIVRAVAISPCVGATIAVLIELPVMLAISWFVCGWSVRLFSVPAGSRTRLQMGAVAFGMLMAAEFVLSLILPNRSVGAFLAAYQTGAGLIGLAGQLAFALFPVAPRRSAWKAP